MDSTTFPQPAGELTIPDASRSETLSRSAASSRAGHHSNVDAGTHPSNRVASTDTSASLRASSTDPQPRHQLQIVTDLTRGAPGDPNMNAIAKRTAEQSMAAKQKNQFYGEVFSYREPAVNARDRVVQDSVVTAEVKTNVIVKDEYSFLTSLSSFLSQRYNRPESSILISLSHSSCLLLGGSFDPAYLMTITALPSLVGPTTNKRNAALIQAHIAEELRVPAERGVIRFTAIEEASLASNGMTVLAEIESKSKNGAARTYPPVPGSPGSVRTEASTARSFFSKKASKRSLKDPPAPKIPPSSDRPQSKQTQRSSTEKRELLPMAEERSGQQIQASIRSDSVLEEDGEDAQRDLESPPKISELPKSRVGSLSKFDGSRRTSVDTGAVDSRTEAPVQGEVEESEKMRIETARKKMPGDAPRSPMDVLAHNHEKVVKRKSKGLLSLFGKS